MGIKVSVLITSHNYAQYLADCINSALTQSWPSLEVIVVDDASTDHSREVIDSFGDQIRSHFVQFENQTRATNTVFELSTGDIVLFLDADDRLRPDAIRSLVKSMTTGTKVTAVKSCGYLGVVDHLGRTTGQRIPSKLTGTGLLVDQVVRNGPTFYRAPYTSGNAWSREFLDQVLPLDTGLSLGPDGQLNLIAPLYGQVAAIDDVVADYRIHGNNRGPESRTFSVSGLCKIVQQQDQARDLLRSWIERELGMEAIGSWPKTWRQLLVELCHSRLSGQCSSISVARLIKASCFTGETSIPKRPLVAAALAVAALFPMDTRMSVYRRMLGLELPSSYQRGRG